MKKAIRELFLDNPSRVTVILTPDTELAARREEEEKQRLAAFQKQCPAKERKEICDICQDLKKAQSAPDTEEALATIPNLVISDMPKENLHIPRCVEEKTATPIFTAIWTRMA